MEEEEELLLLLLLADSDSCRYTNYSIIHLILNQLLQKILIVDLVMECGV